ncbi:MAG: calcium/sodium antiporter [Candidatus Pacebacteria bacterium]|nr:calcium/sodium antiporter [Candidatus Paceibacterota bacterium]
MLILIFLFILGFFILIKSADLVIRGSSSISRYLGISEWLIGVVIVGIGTSLPELAINVGSAFAGTPVGVGTILGSNIFNFLGILGMVSFMSPVHMRKEWVKIDLPLNIAIIVVTGLFLLWNGGGIVRSEAIILFILFIAWMYYMVRRKDDDFVQPHQEKSDTIAWHISGLLILTGLAGVFLGSNWIISGAEKIANLAGLSQGLISLTIISLGTSVPEIAVSLRAIMKKNSAIAVGNLIGSNIFDLIGIFGITGILINIPMPQMFKFDLLFLLITSLIFTIFIFIGKKYTISRWQGLVLILAYIMYLILISIRG